MTTPPKPSALDGYLFPNVEKILLAARELFFSLGFQSVSQDLLARRAKVSEAVLAKHFVDLHSVLEAVIEREADRIAAGINLQPTNKEEFWMGVRQYGYNLLALLNRPEVLNLDRLMHEEARHHQRLAELYFKATYERSLDELSAIISLGQSKKFITLIVPAHTLAQWLLCMWESTQVGKARLGLTQQPFKDPQTWVDDCVDHLFAQDSW